MEKLKEQQITPIGNNVEVSESKDNTKNIDSIKEHKGLQKVPERNSETRKSEEVQKTVSSANQLKSLANTSVICGKTQVIKLCAQKNESERKASGDNKVDMLYKRSESKESLSYRITPGYTIPKKQAQHPLRKNAFSDINDVYSIDAHVLFENLNGLSKSTGDLRRRRNSSDKTKLQTGISHPDMLHPNSIHVRSYTSKPENSGITLGKDSISNSRRSLDQSGSPTDSLSTDSNVPLNNSRSHHYVPKKISFRRYSDHRRSLDASKCETSRSSLSPFRLSTNDTNSKNSNRNRSDSIPKSWNSGRNAEDISPSTLVDERENGDNRSSKPENIDQSQNVSGPQNNQNSFNTARSKAPSSNRSLFKATNQVRPDVDARIDVVRYGSHNTMRSDCVDSRVESSTRRYTIHPDKCKADRSNAGPAEDRHKRKKAGGDKSIRTTGRYVSGNSGDDEYDSSSQDCSLSAKSREKAPSKHSETNLSDETTDGSQDSGYQKSKGVSNGITSNDTESSLKHIRDGDKLPKIRSVNTKRRSLGSKVVRSKIKQNMDNSNRVSIHARKKKRPDNGAPTFTVPSDPRNQATSNVRRINKANNLECKEAADGEERQDKSVQHNELELTSKKAMSNTAPGLVVILEKASTRSTSSVDKTHSETTASDLRDDCTENSLTTDQIYSNQSSSNNDNSHSEFKSDTVSKGSYAVDSHLHSEDVNSNNICAMEEVIRDDSIRDVESQKYDEQKSGNKEDDKAPSQNSLHNDIVDPLEEAFKSIIYGKRVNDEEFVALRKISASNNDDDKLKVMCNKRLSIPLRQNGVKKKCHESSILPIKEEAHIRVNIKELVHGNNRVLFDAEKKNKVNLPASTKIPLDIKSHSISSIRQDIYTEENLETIEELFDGKNAVLVPASEVDIEVVESKLCDANVSTVSIFQPLSIKAHEVSFTSFEAGSCSSLPDFTFELGSAKSSLVESPDYCTATILKPVELIESSVYVFDSITVQEQDVPIVDLVDDKSDIPTIDLTEEADVKEEDPIDDAADIYDFLNKAADSHEQITLYRSDETVNDSLDVQATSVSISPPKNGSCEVKLESEFSDEVKKEMDEEPDSIFTEIELLNVNRRVAKPEQVNIEVDQPEIAEVVYIKDELDNSIPESDSDEGTDSHNLGNAEKVSTETSEKEKEPGRAGIQSEDLSVPTIPSVVPTDDVVLGKEPTSSDQNLCGIDSDVEPVATTSNISERNSQNDHSNQDCVTDSSVEDHHDAVIQEKAVKAKVVQAEIVDALHKIDQIIERVECNQGINKMSSQPCVSVTQSVEEGSHSAPQSLSIPTPTTRATILQNEVVCLPVVSQPAIPLQTSCDPSTSSGTDNSIQR
nr:unnamed protein product [Callosobruchus analis]